VTEHKSSGKKSDIDVSSLSGPEALAKPGPAFPCLLSAFSTFLGLSLSVYLISCYLSTGRKAGDTIMINNDGVAEVYQVMFKLESLWCIYIRCRNFTSSL